MRNKRLLAISAIAISASVFMTACSFGGDGKTDKTETVEAVSYTHLLCYGLKSALSERKRVMHF